LKPDPTCIKARTTWRGEREGTTREWFPWRGGWTADVHTRDSDPQKFRSRVISQTSFDRRKMIKTKIEKTN